MFRKILFPTDFSEGALRFLKIFSESNKMDVGECIILHVVDEGYIESLLSGYSFLYNSEKKETKEVIEMARRDAEKKLKEWKERCKAMMNTNKIKTMVRVGCHMKK